MPNAIKYNVSAETLALKKGNFWIGTGDVGKGPTSSTGYYNGISPPSGGYTIYLNKESGGPSIYTVDNDTQLISLTNTIAGQTFTSTTQCLVYYAGQTDKVCFNRDYEPIITDGLVLNLDAGFDGSYPESGTTWSDLSLSGNNGTLINSPSYYANGGGSIVFDGVDDYVSVPKQTAFVNASQFTLMSWMKRRTVSSKMICYQGADAGNDVSFELWNDGAAYFEVGNAENSYATIGNTSTDWQYLTMVFDGTQTGNSNRLKCYINGSLLNVSYNGTIPSTSGPSNSVFSIGNSQGLGNVNYSDGNISQVLIYNRALTASEVLQNYNAMKDRFAFIFTVDTTKTGVSTSTQFKLPLVSSGSINFVVEWGDGTTDTITTFDQAQTTHTYSSGGTYEIKIRGLLKGWQFANGGDKLKMGVIKNWGCLDISVSSGFYGCSNMTCVASDAPTISSTSLSDYFRACTNFNGAIGNWDVSNVTSLFAMFYGASSFASPLNNWNVSKVQDFRALFVFTPYNSPLNNWDTSSATDMGEMFNVAGSFNQDISNWDVSKVTNMHFAFASSPFNQNIGSWNVSGVTDMSYMFNSSSFNNGGSSTINNWNTSNVTNMSNMFNSNSSFNQNIGSWNVSKVTNFSLMFRSASSFNNGGSSSISGWTMSAATTFNNMFRGASSFNQPIGSWDTRNLTDIALIFESANSFNQNIGTWDMSKVTNVGRSLRSGSFNNGGSSSINNWNLSGVTSLFGMFWDASLFNQPIKDWNITGVTTAGNFFTSGSQYSTANYDDILNTWSQKNVRTGVTINFASIKYSSAGAAGRATLVNTYGWTITDGGQL